MAGIRSLFIVFFLTVLYGCGAEDQKPADATPSVAGTVPIVFENTMLNGAWTSNCYVGAVDFFPSRPGKVVLTFSAGSVLTEGEFTGWYEIYDELDTDCLGSPIVSNFFGTYFAGDLITTDSGDEAFEIDIDTGLDGSPVATKLNIVRIVNNQFYLGQETGNPALRPTDLNFDLVYTFQ